MLPDAYDARIMTEVMLFDRHCGCLSAVFREGGEVRAGNLSIMLANAYVVDIMTGVVVVDTHCGCVCLLCSGGGGSPSKFSST